MHAIARRGRHSVLLVALVACGKGEPAQPPAAATAPTSSAAASPAPAEDAAAVQPGDADVACEPARVTVDGVPSTIVRVSSIDYDARGYLARQLYVWLTPDGPTCEQIKADGFPMGAHWFLITYGERMKSVTATNANSARVEITFEQAEPMAMCIRERAELTGVQWDSIDRPPRVLTVQGLVTATEHCGTKTL